MDGRPLQQLSVQLPRQGVEGEQQTAPQQAQNGAFIWTPVILPSKIPPRLRRRFLQPFFLSTFLIRWNLWRLQGPTKCQRPPAASVCPDGGACGAPSCQGFNPSNTCGFLLWGSVSKIGASHTAPRPHCSSAPTLSPLHAWPPAKALCKPRLLPEPCTHPQGQTSRFPPRKAFPLLQNFQCLSHPRLLQPSEESHQAWMRDRVVRLLGPHPFSHSIRQLLTKVSQTVASFTYSDTWTIEGWNTLWL